VRGVFSFVSTTSASTGKRALRERLIAVRSGLPLAAREAASRAIAARVAALPAWRRARTVALHAPLGAEVDTAELVRLAEGAGKRIAWPRIASPGPALEFACCAAGELVPGPARALEPPRSSPAIPLDAIDLFVVPGVAFDARGGRLGRGRGHYDATLALLRPGAVRVGLAFDEQVVDRVPTEPHDVPLDAVVTGSRVLTPGSDRVTDPVDTVPDA
jgi:5-formyltetrahydrofolate cyclo-ligase